MSDLFSSTHYAAPASLPVTVEGSTRIAEFNSLSEYIEAAALPAETAHNEQLRAVYAAPVGEWRAPEWHGIAPDEDKTQPQIQYMQTLMSDGWPRGAAAVESFARDMVAPAPPVNMRRRRVRGDQGDAVDMGRVWSGDLSRAWSRTIRQPSHGPRNYRVHINPNQPARMPAENITWRAVAALVLADLMTAAGYAVEIRLTVGARGVEWKGKNIDLLHSVIVKPFGAPLDLSALAVVAHPLIMRAADFALRCRSVGARAISENMGYSAVLDEIAPQWMQANPGAVVGLDVEDSHTARAWIAARLAELDNCESLAT